LFFNIENPTLRKGGLAEDVFIYESNGNITYYFKSKEYLLLTVVEELCNFQRNANAEPIIPAPMIVIVFMESRPFKIILLL